MGTQQTTRLDQARRDHEATTAQTAEATNLLLEALKVYFPEQAGSASHQDCISRSEFRSFKDQFRAGMQELEELRAENHEMKSKLGKQEALLNREIHSAKRSEERLVKLEQDDRKDRLSYGTRFSTLEVEMEKNKTKHKEVTRSIDAVRSLFDNNVEKSRTMHEEQTQKIDLCKSKVEAMQQNLDVEVDSKLKDTSETLAATRRDLQELKQQFTILSSTPAVSSTIPTPALEELELRLKATERSVGLVKNDATEKDEAFADQLDSMQSELDQLQVNLNKLQANIEDELPGKRGLTEEDLPNLDAWKDLGTRITDLASKNELSANITRLEELNQSIKSELEASINQVRQKALQGVSEGLKPQLDYISRTIENHIDLLQRHEVRFNSVTTDELAKMMENQWRSAYGLPVELRGLVDRYKQLEAMTIKSYQDVNKKVAETNGKYDGLAAQFQNLVKRAVG
ncbi:unnamed protein product [Aureobasidium vineae]|uniref:Uncharacterized protein n=1 Tax=Aureobasidium vineae TaxID=2773715 RepID=A0A9N8JXN5_9PEZI|nr:unnamed protein product [Aureobasidium vineae]